MKNGKFSHKNRKRRLRWGREFVLLAAVATLLVGTIGGSLAYLFTNSDSVVNTFTPANVDATIPESFDKETKKDVYVENTSNIPVYVRATFTAYWANDDGSVNPTPVSYSVSYGDKWQYVNGIYYYQGVVDANKKTETPFISKLEPDSELEDCHLVVEVIAEVIQAEPIDAVQESWKMTYSGGSWTSYAG